MKLEGKKIGFAMTGSFCTFDRAFETARQLVKAGADVTPIMSFTAAGLSTRFGTASDNREKIERITGHRLIETIEAAEPIGPKKLFDLLIVEPCTANTLAKLAVGIYDTPVTMAVKSHIRNARPVLVAVSTNDALAACAKSIGLLQNSRCYFFVPYRQDNFEKKPNSVVADFSLTAEAAELALEGRQMQPVLLAAESFK